MVAILIILTIVGFVLADILIQRSKARKAAVLAQAQTQLPRAPRFVFENLELPAGIFLGAGHTWLSLGPTGQVQVGMDDFAQRVIGRIDAVELPPVGEKIWRGQRLFTIKQGSRVAEFGSPVDGVVSTVNQALVQNPETMKTSPFQGGWACVLNPLNLAKDLKHLTIAEEAKDWLDREVQRFLAFVVGRPSQHLALGHVLQDGGEPASGLLEMMDDESWGQFIQRFLKETERV
jgi:glycine cleavage system H lipoate-binding protein